MGHENRLQRACIPWHLCRLQELPPTLSAEEAQGEPCQPLVADMCALLHRLLELSHLSDAGEQEVRACRGGCAD